MELNKLTAEVHQNAVQHGWWEEERTFGEIVALCHSELSEALEEYRAGRAKVWQPCTSADGNPCVREGCGDWRQGYCEVEALGDKPEGIAVELADCVIRILDWVGHEEMDADALAALAAEEMEAVDLYGSFGGFVAELHLALSRALVAHRSGENATAKGKRLMACTRAIMAWSDGNGVDMERVLELKHTYNVTRPYRHGGKRL